MSFASLVALSLAISMAPEGTPSAAGSGSDPVRGPLFGVAVERSEGGPHRVVSEAEGGKGVLSGDRLERMVLFEGTLEACERAYLEELENRHGTGRWNFPFRTLGGKQLWADELVYCGWRIQENVVTGHRRLLTPEYVRAAWGSYEACRVALERVKIEKRLQPRSDRAVLLVHGLFRSKECFRPMAEKLEAAGYEVATVGYPSTRRGISEHGDQLVKVLERLEGAKEVSFVAHSLGGLVVREALGRESPWKRRLAVGRLVLIGTPNRGSALAERLKDWFPFRAAAGRAGQELSSDRVSKIPLPPCPFAVIAGGTGKDRGLNPLIPGDNDGVVEVESTKLPGSSGFLLLEAPHATMMRDPEVIEATARFLETGAFGPPP
ncbi:MAG: esterase/lipase family protein [Planctomycetota bacterium]